MDTPSTDRAIAWIRTMRMLGAEEGARIADEFAAMPPHQRTAAVHGFLREITRFTFGPDQSRLAQAASERLGEHAWAELRRSVQSVRDAVAAEMQQSQVAEEQQQPPQLDSGGSGDSGGTGDPGGSRDPNG